MFMKKLYFVKRAMVHFHFPKFMINMWNKVLLFFSDILFDRLAKDNGLVEKYEKEALKPQEKIGNRVWMFWYTGFDSAPSVVKKCVEVVERFEDVDLVLIDKNNLEQYFTFEGRIRELYEKGSIPIQTLADMVRFQLVKRWGGGYGWMQLVLSAILTSSKCMRI